MNEKKRNRYITEYYNLVSGDNAETVLDIPDKTFEFLSLIDYNEIVRPFIKKRMMNGEQKSLGDWAHIYDVSKRIPRTEKKRLGITTDI